MKAIPGSAVMLSALVVGAIGSAGALSPPSGYLQRHHLVEQPYEIGGRVPVVGLYVVDREVSRLYAMHFVRTADALGIVREGQSSLFADELRRVLEPVPIWALFDDGTVLYTNRFEPVVFTGLAAEYLTKSYVAEEQLRIRSTIGVFADELRREMEPSENPSIKGLMRLEFMIRGTSDTLCVGVIPPLALGGVGSAYDGAETTFALRRMMEQAVERGQEQHEKMFRAILTGMEGAPGAGVSVGVLSKPAIDIPVRTPVPRKK